MISPMNDLLSKIGIDGKLFCAMMGLDQLDLEAYKQGRKAVPAELLNRMQKAGFIRSVGDFVNDQVEFLESKIALTAYAGVHGKPVARLSEAERTQALTEAQNQPVSTYQEEDQYIIRYVKNDGSYY